MPIVVYRPGPEAGEKTLTKQRFAFHRSDARDDILHDTAAYFQFAQDKALALQSGAVSKSVFPIANEIALCYRTGAGQGHSDISRDKDIGSAVIQNDEPLAEMRKWLGFFTLAL